MNVETNFLKNQIYLQFFLILNYLLYLFSLPKSLIIFNTLIIIFFLFNAIIDKGKKRLLYIKATIIIYALISLGTPLVEWDARTIWLFHSKRIFYDQNIYSQLDNYFSISHNDYPVLVASLSASLANLINGWNEIFPKFANVILMTSPFLFLSFILKSKTKEFLFVFIIFFIMEKRIIVGEMDMLQSIYLISIIIGIGSMLFNSSKNFSKYFIFYIILNLIIYSHLRPESFYFLILIFLSAVILNFFTKEIKITTFLYLLSSLIPILFWKYLVMQAEINTITNEIFNLELVIGRIFDFSLHFKIFELLFYSKNSIISLIFLSYLIFNVLKFDNNKKSILYNHNLVLKNPISVYGICISIIYFLIIYLSILSSPFINDMLTEIGRFRYNLPVSISICYFVIYFSYQKSIRNY